MTVFVKENRTDESIEKRFYTIDEYLQMEELSRDKHEYFNGKIIAMPGAHHVHNQIAANITGALIVALRKQPFKIYNSDMRIFIPNIKTFVYPDAVVVCERAILYNNRVDTIINPLLVVEVLSPSTEEHDRSTKFWHYQSLPSFKEFLIIEQAFPWVKSFYKSAEHTWNDAEVTDPNNFIFLQSINCCIALEDIYEGVDFSETF